MKSLRKNSRFPLVPVLLTLPLLAQRCASVFQSTRAKAGADKVFNGVAPIWPSDHAAVAATLQVQR
jgi:uncharacterized protein YceK